MKQRNESHWFFMLTFQPKGVFSVDSLEETSPLIQVTGQSQLKNWTRVLPKKRTKKKKNTKAEEEAWAVFSQLHHMVGASVPGGPGGNR